MKVSLSWLKELVDFKLSPKELADQLSLKSIGVKAVTNDYIELDLTYNRGDLLSLRGVAKEVAAVTNSAIAFFVTKTSEYPWVKNNLPSTPVKIEDPELSAVQCVAKIEGLKFEKSPNQWVKRLADSGMRSVNNIADVTNLIMLEYGQPLHAFDQSTVKNDTINVRLAKNGEEILTLDGKLRRLQETDIVLADTDKPLDVAGVMGGKDTEVKESTTTILLSASLFNPVKVRKTAQRLGLHSEASKRFQHGLTKTNLLQSLAAGIKMYESLEGKLTALTLVGDLENPVKRVKLTEQKINSLIGVDIKKEEVEKYLSRLGFKLASHMESGNTNWEVTIPYWRLDINIEEDLIEEVTRMYGYEKIEGANLSDEKIPHLDESLPKFTYALKLKLKEEGLTELHSYSFYSTAVLEALELTTDHKKQLIRVANPISYETEYLRENLWPNLLEAVGKNIKKGYKDIEIFEVGKVYFKNPTGKPQETYRLSIAIMNNTDNPLLELYQITQSLASHLSGVKLNPTNPPKEFIHLFHPKRFVNIEKNGQPVASIAEVHLQLLNKLGIEKRVAVLEINLIDLLFIFHHRNF